MNSNELGLILKELEILRKLKILELIDKGYSQSQLANILGVNQSTISRMLPKIEKKKVKTNG